MGETIVAVIIALLILQAIAIVVWLIAIGMARLLT